MPGTAIDPIDPWAEIQRQMEIAAANTFRVGDVFLSPRGFRFRVEHVTEDCVATLHGLDTGWSRVVQMRWNSPKLGGWSLITPGPAPDPMP
jgi:hypothetical protein